MLYKNNVPSSGDEVAEFSAEVYGTNGLQKEVADKFLTSLDDRFVLIRKPKQDVGLASGSGSVPVELLPGLPVSQSKDFQKFMKKQFYKQIYENARGTLFQKLQAKEVQVQPKEDHMSGIIKGQMLPSYVHSQELASIGFDEEIGQKMTDVFMTELSSSLGQFDMDMFKEVLDYENSKEHAFLEDQKIPNYYNEGTFR